MQKKTARVFCIVSHMSRMKSHVMLFVSLLFIGFVKGNPMDCPEEAVELAGSTIGTASNVTLWKSCGEIFHHFPLQALCKCCYLYLQGVPRLVLPLRLLVSRSYVNITEYPFNHIVIDVREFF